MMKRNRLLSCLLAACLIFSTGVSADALPEASEEVQADNSTEVSQEAQADDSTETSEETQDNGSSEASQEAQGDDSSETSEEAPHLLPTLPKLTDYLNQNMIREILRDYKQDTEGMLLDKSSWLYDSEHDIYYQLNLPYCSYPSAASCEVLSIFVPGAYLNAEAGNNGTYTCTVNEQGVSGGYTAADAPLVFPILTDGFDSQTPVTSYDASICAEYTDHGMICVYAGLRGKANGTDPKTAMAYTGGAPCAVTDLKAAIRFCRLNTASLPGDQSRIFLNGSREGASCAAVTAASGDSRLYLNYLISIGAVMYDEEGNFISDTVFGADVLCPSASPDIADAAYEWYRGQYLDDVSRTGDVWTAVLSDDLTARYGLFVNSLGLVDEDGTELTLNEDDSQTFDSGPYRSLVAETIAEALSDLLSVSADSEAAVKELNTDGEWFAYDPENGTVEITSFETFIRSTFAESRSCPAYDRLNLDSPENDLFGTARADSRHFSIMLFSVINEHASAYSKLAEWPRTLSDDFAGDLACADENGSDMKTRVFMYSPLYFLNAAYDGFESSGIAPVWRISSAVSEESCLLPSDLNLVYALDNDNSVSSLEYEAVWALSDEAGSAGSVISWIDSVLLNS